MAPKELVFRKAWRGWILSAMCGRNEYSVGVVFSSGYIWNRVRTYDFPCTPVGLRAAYTASSVTNSGAFLASSPFLTWGSFAGSEHFELCRRWWTKSTSHRLAWMKPSGINHLPTGAGLCEQSRWKHYTWLAISWRCNAWEGYRMTPAKHAQLCENRSGKLKRFFNSPISFMRVPSAPMSKLHARVLLNC